MALPSKEGEVPGVGEASTSEAPLLSDDGRDFLSGKMAADKYVDATRNAAAEHATRDFDKLFRERLRQGRGGIIIGLSGATLAYAALGLVTLVSKRTSTAFSVVVLTTAAFAALIALSYSRHRDGAYSSGSGRGARRALLDLVIVDALRHLLQHRHD